MWQIIIRVELKEGDVVSRRVVEEFESDRPRSARMWNAMTMGPVDRSAALLIMLGYPILTYDPSDITLFPDFNIEILDRSIIMGSEVPPKPVDSYDPRYPIHSVLDSIKNLARTSSGDRSESNV